MSCWRSFSFEFSGIIALILVGRLVCRVKIPVMILSKVLTFVLCLICLLLPSKFLAQEKTNSAVLVDEFGRMAVSKLIARLDLAISQLQNQPDAKIFIISYRSDLALPGSTPRYLNGIKQYLVGIKQYLAKDRGGLSERIILVDGGISEHRITQIWIAPAGTAPKATITPYQTVFVDTDSARKFDEYHISSSEDFEYYADSYGFDSVNSLEAFAAAVKKELNAKAYVIIYPQYYVEEIEDENKRGKPIIRRLIHIESANTVAKMQSKIRNELINDYHLSLARVKIVNGGYRKLGQVELWILPRGGHPPVATPNAFPRVDRRKLKK